MIDCVMVYDGTDTDGSVWNRCTTHDRLVYGDAYVCEGYEPPPYEGAQWEADREALTPILTRLAHRPWPPAVWRAAQDLAVALHLFPEDA